MMHIWGRLSRVVMACALSVLFLGGTGKTIWAAPAISFTDIAGREVQLDKLPKTFVVANYIANFLMVGGAGSLDKVVGMTFRTVGRKPGTASMSSILKHFHKLKAIPSIGGYHEQHPRHLKKYCLFGLCFVDRALSVCGQQTRKSTYLRRPASRL